MTTQLPSLQDLKLRDDKMTKIQEAKKTIEEADKIVIEWSWLHLQRLA